MTDSGGFTLGTYRLINYTGSFTNNGLNVGVVPAGFAPSDLVVQTSTSGQVNLVVGGGTDTLYWDGSQTTANNAVDGGTGNWTNSTTNWTTAIGKFNASWSGKSAIFSGAAGTVTLADNIAVTGLQFVTSGYIINADAGFSLNAASNISIRIDAGSATINAPFTGSGALSKTGNGTLTLGGDSNYSGGTTVVDGLLRVDNAAGLGLGSGPVSVRASPTSQLEFFNNSSAGAVNMTNAGSGSSGDSGFITFLDSATAGTATIVNQGNTAVGGLGGTTAFFGSSSAGSASFTNAGSAFAPAAAPFTSISAGNTQFRGNSTAGNASFANNGSLSAGGALGGRVFFTEMSTAGDATITNFGGMLSGGNGGTTQFHGSANAGTSSIFEPPRARRGDSRRQHTLLEHDAGRLGHHYERRRAIRRGQRSHRVQRDRERGDRDVFQRRNPGRRHEWRADPFFR